MRKSLMRAITSAISDHLANTTTLREFLDADEDVVLYFWAPWCSPCKMIKPVLAEVEKRLTEVSFGAVDVDQEPEIAETYGVTSIPTLILFRDGKQVRRSIGLKIATALIDFITKG